MKSIKRVLAVLLILATILALSTAALAATKTFYVTATVNFRKGPGLDYGIIRTLHKNDSLKATDFDMDDRGVIWYKAKIDGKTGWVSSKYLSDTPVGKSKIVVTGNKVYLRKDPNLNGKILSTLKGGTVLVFTRTTTDNRGVIWFRVNYDGQTGWVSGKYAKIKK